MIIKKSSWPSAYGTRTTSYVIHVVWPPIKVMRWLREFKYVYHNIPMVLKLGHLVPRKGKNMNGTPNSGFKPVPTPEAPKLTDEQLAQLLAKNPDIAFVTTDEADEGTAEAPTVH